MQFDFNKAVFKNGWMTRAKIAKDDEFYTKYKDCCLEFNNYKNYFYDKIIYCNCDNPQLSNIVKFFKNNFEKFHLKLLYATWYGTDSKIYKFNGLKESYININQYHTGSFDSPESILILKNANIVVTNVPFSDGLPVKFINLMLTYNKLFITTVPALSLCNALYKPFIKNKSFKPGFTEVKKYDRPANAVKNIEGEVDTIWITNIPINNRRSFIPKYTYKLVLSYGNKVFDKIYVKELNKFILYIKQKNFIPKDYNEEMLVPYTFYEMYNDSQFDIITTVTPHKVTKISPKYNSGFIIKKI